MTASCRRCRASALVFALISGAGLGAGLVVSGMTNPAKVTGFLDATAWDPSLAFVMAGAVAVYAVLSRAILRRRDPWFDGMFHLPTRRDLDAPLLIGSALFGIGWALAGTCPGPGIVGAAAGRLDALGFVAAMLGGMWLYRRTMQWATRQ